MSIPSPTAPTLTTTKPTAPPVVTGWALVPLPDPAEHEYLALRARQRLCLVRIAELDAEIAPLTAALETFERDYQARIGALQAELRGVRALIERLEGRTARIHARLVADPNGMLGDLFDHEELREIGEMFGIEIPPSWFRASEEAARDERAGRERSRRNGFEDVGDFDAFERYGFRGAGPRPRARRPSLPDRLAREIRSLYRGLARRFHPDLAEDADDLARRQEMMLRINAAWHDQDLDALRDLDHETADEAGRSPHSPLAQRVPWLRRECDRLDGRIVALTAQLHALRRSDTFPLWFNPALGNSVISQRATTLRIDIATAQRQADEAKDAFRQALHYYAAACG